VAQVQHAPQPVERVLDIRVSETEADKQKTPREQGIINPI